MQVSETDKNVNGKKPLETTTPQLTQSTVWQDMSRPLYSGCEQDTVACEHIWSESASWTLHSAIAKKQNRRSTTSSRTVPSGGNRDTSYGRRVSQPLTSCGERRKTCAAPPSSWQHVDWGSKYGWSTAEEEEELYASGSLSQAKCLISLFPTRHILSFKIPTNTSLKTEWQISYMQYADLIITSYTGWF